MGALLDEQGEPEPQEERPPAQHAQPGEEFFKGTIARVTYRNEQNGFAVLRADAAPESRDKQTKSGTPTTVTGVIPATMTTGTAFIARGEWQTHPKFGRQFRARSITEMEPTGTDAILRYLSSGSVKGFGPVLAERVVKAFGEKTLEILDLAPDRLREVSGIGDKKLSEIKENWRQKKNLREVLLFFHGYGIPLGTAQRIYNAYSDRAIEIVRENPYVLIRDVWGIGFQTADKIALALGIAPDSVQRVSAGILYALRKASDDGHCFLPKEVAIAKSASILGVQEEAVVRSALDILISESAVIVREDKIYSPLVFGSEEKLAKNIGERLQKATRGIHPLPHDLIENACEQGLVIGSDVDGNPKVIRLSDEQQQAIRLAAASPLVVITGGPGCGKTTVTRTIAGLFRAAGLRLRLAAPTGRAAQRLAEVCGMEASTIHRLLKFDPVTRAFLHDENEPLPIDAIIVDESSMIDIGLAASLFAAIPLNARIVVVGDADQLPSVGPGLVLADLLKVDEISRVRLTNLFRRANESLITTIAHSINGGVLPEIPSPDGVTKTDAYFLSLQEPTEIAGLVERLVCDQIPRKFGFKPAEITVLTPMNQGEIGVIALNQRLQARLVPSGEKIPEARVAHLAFRLGDRVCQRVNNYSLHANGVFNGDQGEVVGIDAEAQSVRVRLWDGREIEYSGEALYQLDLAYALSIHRSQGSEVPVVILVLHDSHHILLERQLIYTAVTRAKRLLVVVGSKRALATAVKRNRSSRRYTGLVSQLRELLTSAGRNISL